ncbi:MAG: PQQ-binding-like beta-propeller repeat protein [Verrucomicrobiales bacterium]|nr:PQQ-binding-like beta-propeller repeat protein [Verrucomicrobiales bacterium]
MKILAAFFLPISLLPAGDWPNFHGPNQDLISQEKLPADPDFENVVWRAKVGIGFSSFAVVDGRAYTIGHTGGEQETVWCFDVKTGKEVWKDTYDAPLIARFYEGGPGSTPTFSDSRVFTYSKHGHLHAYDAKTGDLIWKRDMPAEAGLRRLPEWGFACSPLLVDGGKKLVIEAGATFALDPATGEVLWKSGNFTPGYGTPMAFEFAGKQLLAMLKTEGLVVADQADGKTIATSPWITSFDTNSTTPIALADGKIFVSTGYDRGCSLFQLDVKAGSLMAIYESPKMSNHMNNSVLIDGHLYGFDGTAHRGRPTEFVCLELATGKEKWRVPPIDGLGCGSVTATADGTLLIFTEKGELVTAPSNPEAFTIGVRTQILGGRCWTVPVLADGRIFCRNARGDVVCISPD